MKKTIAVSALALILGVLIGWRMTILNGNGVCFHSVGDASQKGNHLRSDVSGV